MNTQTLKIFPYGVVRNSRYQHDMPDTNAMLVSTKPIKSVRLSPDEIDGLEEGQEELLLS